LRMWCIEQYLPEKLRHNLPTFDVAWQIEAIAVDPDADKGVGSISSMEAMHVDQEHNATQATQVTLKLRQYTLHTP